MEKERILKIFNENENGFNDFTIRFLKDEENADIIIKKSGEIIVGRVPAIVPNISNVLQKVSTSESLSDIYFESSITNLMIKIGIPAHIKGYKYIREGVMNIITDPEGSRSVTKVIYPKIAKTFNTTPSRVERAIRHGIEICCNRGNTEILYELFPYLKDGNKISVTNSEFLFTIVDKLRFQLNK